MKWMAFFLAALLLAGCAGGKTEDTQPVLTVAETTVETTVPETVPTDPPATTEETLPPIVLDLTDEEQQMLLKLGMAERGASECETCIAMVMRTVINRVESERFGSSIRGVILAQDQFTPVWDGSYERAEPNEACFAALDMVLRGWNESQGALYYEFCEGESWHSKNLTLITAHCDTRFYQ